MDIVQVVRRYGPVGGMERYVWELSRELASLGHRVTVLCERVHVSPLPEGIRVVEHGYVRPKPRWLAALRFSRRVHDWLGRNRVKGMVVHSHERIGDHDITTFHGPPFAHIRDYPFWKRMSVRVAMNLRLERREICGDSVRMVVPVSSFVGKELVAYYPDVALRLTHPVAPGVAPGPERPSRPVPVDGGVIGFIGYEWKRKGLDTAVRIVAELLKARPRLTFLVAGAEPGKIAHLFRGFTGSYRLLGRVEPGSFYPGLDLLLHPARQEPYGMVVTEAMAARVGVVVSDRCGAADDISPAHGVVVTGEGDLHPWVEACGTMLARAEAPPGYRRSWRDVALEYAVLYERLLS